MKYSYRRHCDPFAQWLKDQQSGYSQRSWKMSAGQYGNLEGSSVMLLV
jgi:hypothetical protein